MPVITEEVERRFWAKVDKTPGFGPRGDCWLWTGALAESGYPKGMSIDGQKYRASHVALAIADNPRPAPELHALHSCDTKRCVRHDHLRWGTDQENMNDWLERRSTDKFLSAEVIREIRACNDRPFEIAKRFGIHQSAVAAIKTRRSYKHIP